MDKNKKLIFVAYQGTRNGNADENIDAIRRAAIEYNKYQNTYVVKTWEDYTKTDFISASILNAIKNSAIFIADLTYFNHNVLFELGYAIALNKNILVILNDNIKGASENYHNSFLKDIKYHKFINSHDLQIPLQQKSFNNDWINRNAKIDTINPKLKCLFYMESQRPNQASLDLTDYLEMLSEEKKIDIISENRNEIQYQSINWYITNIFKARIVIIHFLGNDIENSFLINAFNSFWAGIGSGFEKDVLLIAPAKYKAPLDYYDIMIQYRDSNHLIDELFRWLGPRIERILKEQNQNDLTENCESELNQEMNLLRLGIGCEIAENERENLLDYFVSTFSYEKSKEAKSTLIIGRKGSGKSAIYIKLANELISDKKNYLINLKPESDELLSNVDLSMMYKSDSSRITFFFSVWKCVILSHLFHSILSRVKEKESKGVILSNSERSILNFYQEKSNFIGLNFFGVIEKINRDYLGLSSVTKPDILEYLYKYFIGPTKKIIIEYFNNLPAQKYCQIIIIADNLDKTWNADKDLTIQVEMISTLLEVEDKIKHELTGLKIKLRTTLFLRKDIFEYICATINEPDKLLTQTHEINWESYPVKLKELIENRFRYVLKLENYADIEKQVWSKYFQITNKGEHPFNVIEKIITKRPRDLLYFIGRMFESAINNNRLKVNKVDLKYATDIYTRFLSQNIIAEIRAVFPEAEGILSRLQQYHGQKLEYKVFLNITREYGYDKQRTEKLMEQLFDKGYMIGYDDKTKCPFTDIKLLKKQLNEKRLFGFIKNRVFIIAHAKYYYIKNDSNRSF